MKTNKLTTILVFIFLVVALSSLAAADNITYTYTKSGSDITSDTMPIPDQENITLPDTTWNLVLENNDSRFRLTIPDINATSSGYPELNITARVVDLDAQTYDGDLKKDSGTYVAKYAYAFDIDQLTDKDYAVSMDYSGLSISNPRLFKCDYDFVSGTTSTSSCELLSTSTSNNRISATTTNFSSFFIAQYNAPGGGGGGGTGSGGGGGGGLGGPRIVYVTPTPEGSSVQLYDGDELIVQHDGGEYHFRVIKAVPMQVELKDLQIYVPLVIKFGDTRSMGLTSMADWDVKVSMHLSNEFVMLTFKTSDSSTLPFPLLPPRPRTQEPATGAAQPSVPSFTRPAQTAPTTAGPGPSQETPDQIELPESPINMWTIIFAIVFVIFLVGGVALYRTRLHRLEKPPTVTRTGLETAGLPETSSKDSKPAPILKPEAGSAGKSIGAAAVGKAVEKVSKPESKPKLKPKPPVKMTHEQELELKKYVFHAYSLGFKEEQVRDALLEKGWPEGNVDKIIAETRSKK